jgi:hypothetical protein
MRFFPEGALVRPAPPEPRPTPTASNLGPPRRVMVRPTIVWLPVFPPGPSNRRPFP